MQCKDLYNCIKDAMERGGTAGKAPELGGEFPVQDLTTGMYFFLYYSKEFEC